MSDLDVDRSQSYWVLLVHRKTTSWCSSENQHLAPLPWKSRVLQCSHMPKDRKNQTRCITYVPWGLRHLGVHSGTRKKNTTVVMAYRLVPQMFVNHVVTANNTIAVLNWSGPKHACLHLTCFRKCQGALSDRTVYKTTAHVNTGANTPDPVHVSWARLYPVCFFFPAAVACELQAHGTWAVRSIVFCEALWSSLKITAPVWRWRLQTSFQCSQHPRVIYYWYQ